MKAINLLPPPEVDEYYTDGTKLYRITAVVGLKVLAENCINEKVRTISFEKLRLDYQLVEVGNAILSS